MEFRHLKTFQAIAQAGSFLKAAEKLQYAQSTITLHIQKLESELGVRLFSRKGKRTELTAAGKTLENHADQLLHRATQLQQAMTDLVTGEARHLRIGSIEPVASVHLPPILAPFCQQHPKLQLTLEVGITRVISQKVADSKLDFGLCSLPAANLGLKFEPLFEDPITLLLPAAHPLARVEKISVAALAEERLILTEEHCPYREVLEKALLPHGVNPFMGTEVMSSTAITQMVRYGLGIGVLPNDALLGSLPQETVIRSITGLDLSLQVGLVSIPEPDLPDSTLHEIKETIRATLRTAH